MWARRARRFIRTSFGANPVATLTELLQLNSTCGTWTSRASCLVDDHRQYLSHGVLDALDATIGVGVVRARRDFLHVEELVHG